MLGKTILTDIFWMGVKIILMRIVGSMLLTFLLVVLFKTVFNQWKGKIMVTIKQVSEVMPGLLMHEKAMMESTVVSWDVFFSTKESLALAHVFAQGDFRAPYL